MAWNIIRKATDEDQSKLEKRARTFAARYNISVENEPAVSAVEGYIDFERYYGYRPRGNRLRWLWIKVVRRALNERAATGIAYGYVGYTEE